MNDEFSNIELEGWLKRLKWDKLKQHTPEFIAKIVVKTLRKKGVQFFKVGDEVEYEVVPCTKWHSIISHETNFVYQGLNGYRGTIIHEREVNGVIQCTVRLQKNKNTAPFVTSILKQDLQPCAMSLKENTTNFGTI